MFISIELIKTLQVHKVTQVDAGSHSDSAVARAPTYRILTFTEKLHFLSIFSNCTSCKAIRSTVSLKPVIRLADMVEYYYRLKTLPWVLMLATLYHPIPDGPPGGCYTQVTLSANLANIGM